MTPKVVRAAVAPLPRVRLAHLPTPLDFAPRLTAALGGKVRIYIKRDDCTGLLLGGNKARHNEFLMGDAMAERAEVVVWGAGVQSNNCRQTAAACAKLGLECHLHLSRGHYDTTPQGNLLLDYLVGAKVEFTDAVIGPELDEHLRLKASELRATGRRVYFWDRARVVPLAAISYVLCIAEIQDQLTALGEQAAAVYVSSSGSTGAGVALGAKLLGMKAQPRLICPMPWPWSIPEALAADANTAAALLKLPHRLTASEIDADENYIAPGYGKPSPAGRHALELTARTEAILLDPVYSAKAMAALILDVQNGRYAPGSTVVFIHTGGVPAIFAHPENALPAGFTQH